MKQLLQKILQRIEILLTSRLIMSNYKVYNSARAIRCLIDNISIKYAFKTKKPLILIYQQGRVASTSVYGSIKSLNLHTPIYHVHTLSTARANKQIELLRKGRKKIYRHLFIGKYLGRIIENNSRNALANWKIISIFRDPLDIILSLHFLNIDHSSNHKLRTACLTNKEEVMAYFNQLFEHNNPSKWDVCRWFDDVFKNELGVNVYSYDFDVEQGYSIINSENISILLLRFESLEFAYKYGVSELFNLDPADVNLQHIHIHRNDSYSDIHKYVKQNLKVSKAFYQELYSTKFIKHFYSHSMIKELQQKWSIEA